MAIVSCRFRRRPVWARRRPTSTQEVGWGQTHGRGGGWGCREVYLVCFVKVVSWGSGRSGSSVGGRMPNTIVKPSAAYGLGRLRARWWRAARRTGWRAAWRRGWPGGGGDVVSYFVHWSRAARPKLLQHRGCHKAAVMRQFTATRPPLHTLAQAVEDARGVWRRRWSARFAQAASGKAQAPACSRRITQQREGDAPRQRIDCLGGGRRGWLNFKNGLYTRRCTIRESRTASHARYHVDCYSQTTQRVCQRRACARRWRRS